MTTLYIVSLSALVLTLMVAGAAAVLRELRRGRSARASVGELAGKLEHLAYHDQPTGLPNRRAFLERLRRAMGRNGPAPIVMIADLDGFKAVNETHGHARGDALLAEIGGRLQRHSHAGLTLARLGGDEFGALLEGADKAGAVAFAEQVAASVAEPVSLQGAVVYPRLTVGIHIASGSDPSHALRKADAALRQAKRFRRGGYRFFDPAEHEAQLARDTLRLELGGAVERGEFVLEYQPIVDLNSGHTRGGEALLRWQHPGRGLLGPAHFIELAESSGLIVEIGDWVLGEVCRQAADWHARLDADLGLALNVSPKQLDAGDFPARVEAALATSGVDPSTITLEVTETVLAGRDREAIDLIASVRALGVRIAIDDFGTGYSSLGRFRSLPVDIVKIDRSFVRGIAEESDEWTLARTVVGLARSLGKETIAEGVELPAQLAHLRALHCDLAQGFLFSAALPSPAFEARQSQELAIA